MHNSNNRSWWSPRLQGGRQPNETVSAVVSGCRNLALCDFAPLGHVFFCRIVLALSNLRVAESSDSEDSAQLHVRTASVASGASGASGLPVVFVRS